MSTIVGYTKIDSGAGATPGLFNSRMSQLQLNIDTLNAEKLETVDTPNLADGAVTNAKLAINAVTNSKVLDGSLQGAKLNANSLDWSSNVSVESLTLKDSSNKFKLYFENGSVKFNYAYGSKSASLVLMSDDLRLVLSPLVYPTSSVSAGSAGEISANSQYLYVCVSDSSWKRAAISGW
jgi:hypothetical protein